MGFGAMLTWVQIMLEMILQIKTDDEEVTVRKVHIRQGGHGRWHFTWDLTGVSNPPVKTWWGAPRAGLNVLVPVVQDRKTYQKTRRKAH